MAPGLILSSPLLRAKQSAEMAAGILGFQDAVVETPALTPNSSPQRVWEEIRKHRDVSRMLLVGHQPLLGATYAFLLQAPSLMVDEQIAIVAEWLDRTSIQAAAPAGSGVGPALPA